MKECKIIIQDEVNCKLSGLELTDRKKLMKMFEYEIPGARFRPSVQLGRWNGKVSYFSLGGSTFINLLESIIPVIDSAGYDIQIEDLRTTQNQFVFTQIQEDTFSNHTWPKGHPQCGEPIKFRDYQLKVVNDFLANIQSVQEVATGAGKTLMTAALSHSVEKYGRSIVVVPNKSLVVQTEADYVNLGLDVGVYFGERKEIGRTHTICTWQSLNNILKATKAKEAEVPIGEFIEDVVCLIIDEAHMAQADVLKTLLTGPFGHIPIRWGLTGTIPKELFASQALFVSLGPVINKLAASELQDKGVLARCHVNVIQMQDNVEFKDYQSELKHLLEDKSRLDNVAELILNIKESGNTLVLVDRVNAGKELIDRIPDSVFVSGGTKLSERKEEYDEIATSNNKVIVATYGVAAVGINIPRIFNLILVEPGKSFVRVIQSIGRGIRKAEDKDFVQIWDITSNCRFSKRHLAKRKDFYKDANYPFTVEKLTYK
jgi:superfamily II DNA or RNA helicase